jgi:small subunit ribosomal protein S5
METSHGNKSKSNNNAPKEPGLEKVIQIDRINKVVKGGKRLSFRAFIIKGNQTGSVGFATGKSKEVPVAIKKGIEKAQKHQYRINIINDTIPHEIVGKYGSSKVILKPARPGTGVIAGGPVRIMLEALGVKDVVAKALGSNNALNTARATMDALLKLKHVETEEVRRGKKLPVKR